MLIRAYPYQKGEHLVTRGEEVCYLYYLESGIVRLWFPDKENREISARFIQAKEFINFSFHMKNTMPTTISRHWSHARSGDCPKRSSSAIWVIHQFQQAGQNTFGKIHQPQNNKGRGVLHTGCRSALQSAFGQWKMAVTFNTLKRHSKLYRHHATSIEQHPKAHINQTL